MEKVRTGNLTKTTSQNKEKILILFKKSYRKQNNANEQKLWKAISILWERNKLNAQGTDLCLVSFSIINATLSLKVLSKWISQCKLHAVMFPRHSLSWFSCF